MRTVHEVSKLAGVSVRTLHHYDAIGLLKPTAVTPAGYRLYDDSALERLQDILLFRELQFPLREIKALMDSPGFDRKLALRQQIGLLKLRRKRLDELISFAQEILRTGERNMSFTAFDKTELEAYAAEAKKRWGLTGAYQEFESRAREGAFPENLQEFMEIFARMGRAKDQAPDSPQALALVEELRGFITEHFYTCTPEILQGLGEMYRKDPRFQGKIDQAGGPGTAAFASAAIEAYCAG